MSILSAVFLTASTSVFAQVTVDLHALQALPERSSNARPPRPAPSAAPAVVTRVAPTSPPPAVQPAMPENVPETATISPIMPAEPPAGSVPPAPPVSDTAATTAAPTTNGLRLAFTSGQSDLSPDSTTSIKQLTEAAPPGDATTFNVLAYAAGKPDDPSTARRVSLARAMAVRSALVASGVPSARIFVRALGEQSGDGPADRVDIGVTGANAPPASATTR